MPLIWSWPGEFEAGIRSPALVELTDIAPTLLDVCGLPVPDYMTGRPLLPILSGQQPAEQHRDYVRSEYIDAIDLPDGTVATMYFDGRYKLICYHNHGLGELYDLEADPQELADLWDDPAYLALKGQLLQRSVDAHMTSLYAGPARIGPM